jgi:hypothetical protein
MPVTIPIVHPGRKIPGFLAFFWRQFLAIEAGETVTGESSSGLLNAPVGEEKLTEMGGRCCMQAS